MSELSLSVNGAKYGGWKSVTVHRSIEHLAGGFEVSTSEIFPSSNGRRIIEPGDACTVELDDDTVITGYVDTVHISYSANSHNVQISGRDATCDLVDCSPPPVQYLNQTLTRFCELVCAPFDIPVTSVVDEPEPFRTSGIDWGQTAFEAISEHCYARAVMPMSDGKGGLLLTRAGEGGAATRLVYGENILECRASASLLNRFSEYNVGAQNDLWYGEDTAGIGRSVDSSGQAFDRGVLRYRPTHRMSQTPDHIGGSIKRAHWQAAVAMGRSQNVEATVVGWRDGDNELWAPNKRVYYEDPVARVERSLLISQVEFSKNEQGTKTKLTLMPNEAFELIRQPLERDTQIWNRVS